MLRTLFHVYALVLPMTLALGLFYLYFDGAIGIGTAVIACIVLAAVVITGMTLYEDGEERELFRMGDWRL